MPAGRKPKYQGKVSNEEQQNIGQISVWDNENPSSEKSPIMTGTIEVYGKKLRVALWAYKPKEQTNATNPSQ